MDFSNVKLYDWVEFFTELAEQINKLRDNDDRDSKLFELATQSFGEESAICKYDYVDPFSFIYYLAQRNTRNQKDKYFSAIKDVFSLNSDIPTDIVFPTPTPNSTTLYHDGQTYNNDILWNMFGTACAGDDFTDADFLAFLQLKAVGCSKLTQTLFLINPESYLPIDINVYLTEEDTYKSYPELKKAIDKFGFRPYKQAMDDISKHFPGCHLYEINLFSYLKTSNQISEPENYFQIGSNVYGGSKGEDTDYIQDFYSQSGVWVGGPSSGGNGARQYPITDPDFGDIVLSHINHYGNGIGIVLDNQYAAIGKFDKDSIIKVLWIAREERPNCLNSSQMLGMSYARTITQSFLDQFPESRKVLESLSTGSINPNHKSRSSEAMKSLNQILYGPPGTGKTYETVLLAAELIEQREMSSYNEALEIFNEHLGTRIEFITFHQNYSYEDFIQGLRPDIDNSKTLNFERKDGVFLRISNNALFEYYKAEQKGETQQEVLKDKKAGEVYLDFLEHLKITEKKTFQTINKAEVHLQEINKNKNLLLRHGNSSKTYVVSAKRLIKLFEVYPDISKIQNVNNDIRDAIGGCNSTIYWVILKEFIQYYNNYTVDIDTDSAPEEKLEEIDYETKKELLSTFNLSKAVDIDSTEINNYVLIIDEINRANISRVFGELITLIEPDKRSHGELTLRCTLPSGEEFIVPSNLYIIGTMNTADKSIALLDIALRRRFIFTPMYPKYEIPGFDINDSDILKKINGEIVKRKGYDFQIGHSYFMGDNYDRATTMNNKVIPLLLEYFMNDEKEVRDILKVAELRLKENSWPIEIE
ncbi:MAG: AAA domain-containing protein [Spirochaetales bacterium]|nr:AAA domain-containing protein [Spirochaetales bacterium]